MCKISDTTCILSANLFSEKNNIALLWTFIDICLIIGYSDTEIMRLKGTILVGAGFEQRKHTANTMLWVGKYRNLHSMPHWHLEYELIACRSGETHVAIDGQNFTMTDGTAAFVPSGGIHHIEANEKATVVVAQLDPALVPFVEGTIQLTEPVFADRYGVFEKIDGILKEVKAEKPYFGQRANAVMVQLFIEILRAEKHTFQSEALPAAVSRYWQLLSAINEESESMDFSEAAARMHLSEAYFSRYFKQMAGMPFSEYLNLIKIDKAVGILKQQPEITTAELAIRCGFNTLRSFNRVFRKVTGYSPKQLPKEFTLHIRQFAVPCQAFDPTLSSSVALNE